MSDHSQDIHALREGAGQFEPSSDRLVLTGADRQRFLHGLVTCDVQGLEPGSGAFGFLCTIKGKVLADVAVLALPDRLWLELPPGSGERIAAHLTRYVIADRVEIAPLAAEVLAVAGPRAGEILAAAGLPAPDGAWRHEAGSLGGVEVRVVRHGLLGVPGFEVWAAGGGKEAVAAALRAAGAAEVRREAAEAVRVEAGVPRWGLDYGEDHFPQETGLETAAVSYSKGCYLGQEVVARIHYRGGVNRKLVGVVVEPGAAAATGDALLAEGREAGTLGTVVDSPGRGRIALAVLHERAASPGTRLEVSGRGGAEVAALPFGRESDRRSP